jgi:isopenicillin-N epimerase
MELSERPIERRDFLRTVGGGVGVASLAPLFGSDTLGVLEAAAQQTVGVDPQQVAQDETFWREIQQAFSVSRSMINLNSGSVGACPTVVTDSLFRYVMQQEEAPAFQRGVLAPRLETVREGLANQFGCDAEEIALMRSTTEAMQTVLLGLDLRRDDEVLVTAQEYPPMIGVLKRREQRDGIRIKTIDIPSPAESMDEIVNIFEQAMTVKTRLILVSHPTYLDGQFFPIKRICEIAHQRGIEVAVDGAHSFGQIDIKHEDMDCDYYGSSLHKWLNAPKGTGMLYVRRAHIGKVWPMAHTPNGMDENIRKFEMGGTKTYGIFLSIGDALAFHRGVGPKRKEERLRYLTNYWAQRLQAMPKVHFYTSLDPGMSCAIATIRLEGLSSAAIYKYLWDKHNILTAGFNLLGINGLRMSPNLFTTLDELDQFCEVMERVANNGLPQPYSNM